MRQSLWRLIGVATALGGCTQDAPPLERHSSAVTPVQVVSADSAFVAGFLKYLGSDLTRAVLDAPFDVAAGGHWDPDRVLAYLSDTTEFYDINRDTTWRVAALVLRRELAARTGKSFTQLVHLGNIAAQGYPQYSRLEFDPAPDAMIVHVGDDLYRVVLTGDRGATRVARIEYRWRHDK